VSLIGVFYEGGTSCLRRCRFLGSKVPLPRVEGAAFIGAGFRVKGSWFTVQGEGFMVKGD